MNDNLVEIALEQDAAGTSLDRARAAATEALQALGEEISRNLSDRLNAVDNPARAEISALQAKAAALRESYSSLRPRAESKVRLLATLVDEAIAGGRDEEAAQKRAEATDLQTNLENIEAEANGCDARVVQLERQRSSDIEAVFKEAYGDARMATVAVSTGLAELLDRTWEALCQYDRGNNRITTGLAGIRHKINLTPDERGVEKKAFLALTLWFGYGGRFR